MPKARDEDAVRRFVEHFAMTLSDLGFPRMPARVLAMLTVTDEPGLTAGQLGERLGVSPAAVSGAVRYLIQLQFVVREPVLGSRSDHYRLPPDPWFTAGMIRSGVYKRFADIVHEGVVAVGDTSSPAGARLAEMEEFYVFIQEGMSELLERWEKLREERGDG
ncbi:MarR family transcriptional regulator [Phytohabitans sp. ZYX-F-186]|uniref:MarR family transcriptional regulator n=1 Tax=Phytohabitans maris TaxID=3071409 RepID=A0ABU0ZN57_9ACTN|nr:MarR family transcriptional regulator [Phytohabitans sp. ZYX-F-186]MDQ7907809.1 MarR family transcriptional regulator [Phytohabitans sp. ZYX-F-186]